jgi:hypothetical protein
MRTPKFLLVATILAMCMGFFATRANAEQRSGRRLRATLQGFNETPANSTPPGVRSPSSVMMKPPSRFELNYSDLVADSLARAYPPGPDGVAEGVMIFLRHPNPPHSTRSCPTREGTVTGTVTSADVIGPTAGTPR